MHQIHVQYNVLAFFVMRFVFRFELFILKDEIYLPVTRVDHGFEPVNGQTVAFLRLLGILVDFVYSLIRLYII